MADADVAPMQMLQAGSWSATTCWPRATSWRSTPTAIGRRRASSWPARPTDVKIEVLTAGGQVIDTMQLGALAAGQHGFSWTPARTRPAPPLQLHAWSPPTAATAVAATSLMRDKVIAVGSDSDGLHAAAAAAPATWPTAPSRPSSDLPPPLHARSTSMSFQQGLSGLNAASRNLDVIGHNIANANTVGCQVLARRVRRDLCQRAPAASAAPTSASASRWQRVAAVHAGQLTITGNTWTWRSTAAASSRSRRTDGTDRLHAARQLQARQGRQHRHQPGAQLMGYPTTHRRRAPELRRAAAAAADRHADPGQADHQDRRPRSTSTPARAAGRNAPIAADTADHLRHLAHHLRPAGPPKSPVGLLLPQDGQQHLGGVHQRQRQPTPADLDAAATLTLQRRRQRWTRADRAGRRR